jgi:hypothetical protein
MWDMMLGRPRAQILRKVGQDYENRELFLRRRLTIKIIKDWAQKNPSLVLNPSYAAMREICALVDQAHAKYIEEFYDSFSQRFGILSLTQNPKNKLM